MPSERRTGHRITNRWIERNSFRCLIFCQITAQSMVSFPPWTVLPLWRMAITFLFPLDQHGNGRARLVFRSDRAAKAPFAPQFGTALARSHGRRRTVHSGKGRRTNGLALLGIKAAKPAMDAILLIADNNVRRRGELRRFFWDSRFLVAEAADGLKCLAELPTLEPHVHVLALEIPRGGGEGVILRLNDGLASSRKPLILVIGNATVETLSARTGVAPCNCFPTPFREEDLLERIGTEFAAGLPRDGEDRPRRSEPYARPTFRCVRVSRRGPCVARARTELLSEADGPDADPRAGWSWGNQQPAGGGRTAGRSMNWWVVSRSRDWTDI